MPQKSLLALGLVLTVLAWAAGDARPVARSEGEHLSGAWQITSVHRDGEPDPTQVGEVMVLTDGTIRFAPRFPQIVDGTS
jgi:hypothetical protein